jgi:mono/diheme cytochrome c family protein
VTGSAARRLRAGRIALWAWLTWALAAMAETPAERGRYLAAAGGCVSCHTEDREGAPPFAGGRALVTDFGTFYSPNITPDRVTGIGNWTDEQFVAALHEGTGPGGTVYFPAFPYPAYAGMTRDDALAIKAYLFSLPPVSHTNRAHDLRWFLRSRLAAAAWRWLFFRPLTFVRDAARDEIWNRGAYLVRHLGHCGECHTPRNFLGVPIAAREMAGNPAGPEHRKVPNITPDETDGIGDWSASDLETFLEIGMLPDGDFAGSGMGQVIDENTSQLTPEDRRAIVSYLRALPPRPGAAR